MRRGEVVGLRWSDLDQETSRLSIQRTLQCVAGRPVEFGVKSRTSRRCIDLDTTTVDTLREWRRRLGNEDLDHGPDDWMFCNRNGRFLNPESASQLFGRIIANTTLPRIRFHDLRHTHASLLIAAGIPIKVVSERLGHAPHTREGGNRHQEHPGVSARYRGHCHPGTGAASEKCHPATGATMSTMNRDCTKRCQAPVPV
jgi:integrase